MPTVPPAVSGLVMTGRGDAVLIVTVPTHLYPAAHGAPCGVPRTHIGTIDNAPVLGGTTVTTKVAEPAPELFVALMVTLVVAAVVRVPEITPVAVLTVNPPGSGDALKLVGLPVAVIM